VKTTAGPLGLERPRVRNASALGFASASIGKGVARTHALEALVVCSFPRGLSVRDVEAALEEASDGPVVSKTAVARIRAQTRQRYRAWRGRRLEERDLVYLFLDAIYPKLRPDDTPAEGVLVAWGVTLEGREVLLGLQLGSRESHGDWLDFGRDLLDRGLRSPALVVADGAPGRWKAARELRPAALEQRCALHLLASVLKKLPERLHRELKARHWRILDEAGWLVEARAGLLALVADYRSASPSATAVFERDLEALVCHLRFPSEHRKRIRSTNPLERTFVEARRRTKVIGRFPGETSALCLIWAVLASRGWRGVVTPPKAAAEIERLRRGLTAGAPDEHGEEVVATPRGFHPDIGTPPQALAVPVSRLPLRRCMASRPLRPANHESRLA